MYFTCRRRYKALIYKIQIFSPLRNWMIEIKIFHLLDFQNLVYIYQILPILYFARLFFSIFILYSLKTVWRDDFHKMQEMVDPRNPETLCTFLSLFIQSSFTNHLNELQYSREWCQVSSVQNYRRTAGHRRCFHAYCMMRHDLCLLETKNPWGFKEKLVDQIIHENVHHSIVTWGKWLKFRQTKYKSTTMAWKYRMNARKEW